MAQGNLKPNGTWGIKHATNKNFHVSGPPRDIVGVRDYVANPYQRRLLEEQEAAHRAKFAAGHEVDDVPMAEIIPEEIPVPINQKLDWYIDKAHEAARHENYVKAYWFFKMAARKAQSFREQRRWDEAAESNAKTWRLTLGIR